MVNFKVKSKDFIESVGWAIKDLDSRDEAGYVVFDLDNEGNNNVFHENKASYMRSPLLLESIDLGDDDELKVAVSATFLKRLLPAVKSSESLSFSWEKDDAGINVKASNATFTLPIMDFKIPSDMKITVLGEVDDNEYFDAIQRLSKLCPTTTTGTVATLETVDLNFDVKDKRLTMMATDKYTLGEISIDFEPNEENAKDYFKEHEHIFLGKRVASLIPATKDSLASVSIISGSRGDKYGYLFANGKVALFATKDVPPITYKNIKEKITEADNNDLIVNTKELEKAIAIVSSLAWNESTVILEIGKDELAITDNDKLNTFGVELDQINTDDDYKVKFTRSVINNSFSPISTEKVKISWEDDKKAFSLTPVLDNGEDASNVFVFCVPSTRG